MKEKFGIKTEKRNQFVDITDRIQTIVGNSGIQSGICTCYVPHTTAGITINENADPSVKSDIIDKLNRLVPPDEDYSHREAMPILI